MVTLLCLLQLGFIYSGTKEFFVLLQVNPGFIFEVRQGDIFALADPQSSLAHCVSADLHLGGGISKGFRDQFGRVNELKAQFPQVGNIVVLAEPQRFIYNLVTKPEYKDKPSYDALGQSLAQMKAHALLTKQQKISMPRLGCGLDKLDWNHVSRMIMQTFQDTNIHIVVYVV